MTEMEAAPERISRVVDFRIPLPWLIGACSGIGWALISMYFSVNNLVKTVGDLQIDVKAGNNSVVAVAGELALLKYRLSNAEESIQRVTDTVKKGAK